MRRPLLLFAGIALPLLASAADEIPKTHINLNAPSWHFSAEELSRAPKKNADQSRRLTKKIAAGVNDCVGALQSFQDFDYNFTYTDGTFTLYPMTIEKSGDTVIFGNLLNYDDEFMSYYGYVSVDVNGTYDAEAKTVTIPTPHENGNDMTVVGMDDWGTNFVLIAGHLDESNEFWPVDELVFNVEGDFERLTTTQNIGVISVYDGETGYLEGSYNSMIIQPTASSNPLVAAPSSVNLGESFPGNTLHGNIQLLNMSNEMITFALALDADEGRLTLDPQMGTVYPLETYFIYADFDASAPGEFDIPVRVSYETESAEAELTVDVLGNVKDFPDYSPIVTKGDFGFLTGNKPPFTLVTEGEDAPYAVSPGLGSYETAWLEATFEVPENCTGHLTTKGSAVCIDPDDYYASYSSKIILDGDEEPVFSTREDADFDLDLTVGPGSHSIRFEYSSGWVYFPAPNMCMKITDLALSVEMMAAEGVEIITPMLDFGGLLVADEPVSKTLPLEIRNMGSNPLRVLSVESTDPAFTAEIPDTEASLMESVFVPVTLTADKAGRYTASFTIATSAGALTAEASAVVRQAPDFSSILEGEADVTVTTDADFPFLINADGQAYSINGAQASDVETVSSILFTVTVPENKIVYTSWDATFNGSEGTSGRVQIDGPTGLDIKWFDGTDFNASSSALYPDGSSYLEMVPGVHTVEFTYIKQPDVEPSEANTFVISKFITMMEDFDPKAAELSIDKVRFADCLIPETGTNSNKSFAVVYIKNLGSDELRVLRDDELTDLPSTDPFGYRDPGYVVHHGSSLMVDLIFFPQSEGTFEGEAIIPTTFGDFKVGCTGRAYTAEGMLLVSNFDSSAGGWTFIDKDGDSNSWFNVTDRYSYRPDWYTFSGNNALMSLGTKTEGAYSDNYAVSPEFSIPADGGMLSWWVAPLQDSGKDNLYQLSIIPADEFTPEKLGTYPVAFEEAVNPENVNFHENSVDLSDFAGRKVRLAFRHNASGPKSGIVLDDVYAYTIAKWKRINGIDSIEAVINEADILEIRCFDPSGARVSADAKGLVIKQVVLRDGSVHTFKTMTR